MSDLFGVFEFRKLSKEYRDFLNEKNPVMAYNSVSAEGEIVGIAPPSGQYPVLVLIAGTTDTDGNIIEAQALDTEGNWRTFLRIRLLGNTPFAIGFPCWKVKKVRVGDTEYNVKPGDGETKTLRLAASGSGNWEGSILYYTEA